MIAIRSIVIILFGSTTLFGFIKTAIEMVGLWGIFRKCGQNPWKALIPYYNDYALSECAGRQPEGLHVFITGLLMAISPVVMQGMTDESMAEIIVMFVTVAVGLDYFINLFKVYLGLIEVFDRKKRWILLFIIPYVGIVVTCLYGWHKAFQPLWKLQDFRDNEANFFSGAHAQALDNGLTVNINERTVRKLFGKQYLLRDIHMYIKPGRMVLLLGGSGAGKTTFLNAVIGQDLMRGNDTVLRTLTDAAAMRLPVDFDSGERRARVDEVMKIFGLLPIQNNLVDKLSGGQKKRLSIAMEFISNPALFILDEPDSGLDGVMARELMEQLRRIADQGKIVVVITHTPDRVIDLFDDVIVLAKDANRTGRLAYFGSIDGAREFFGKDRMEQIVRSVNRQEEGGEGKADEFIKQFAQAQSA